MLSQYSSGSTPVAVCTVTYESGPIIKEAVESVQNQQGFESIPILVVDNASSWEYWETLRSLSVSHGVHVERLEDNVGFSKGFNYAVRKTWEQWRPRLVIMLNPDVIIPSRHFVAESMRVFEELDEEVVALQPRVVPSDEDPNDTAVVQGRRIPDWQDLLIAESVILRFLCSGRYRRFTYQEKETGRCKTEVIEVPSGACLVCRTEQFLRSGMFDPELFLYAEEYCLGARLERVGLEVRLWNDGWVYHRQGTSTGFDGEHVPRNMFRHKIESTLKYLKRYQDSGPAKLALVRLGMELGYLTRLAWACWCSLRRLVLRLVQAVL